MRSEPDPVLLDSGGSVTLMCHHSFEAKYVRIRERPTGPAGWLNEDEGL